MRNPWKRLASRIVYRNPWLTLREDTVVRPDGNEGIYGVIETSIATGVVALSDDQEIYLVGQYRYTLDRYSWEIIEGGSEGSESGLAAAKRELLEEAGLKASRWTRLGPEVHLSNCISSECGELFLAEGLTLHERRPDATELLEIKKLSFAHCLEMVERGEISDAMSIIGIYRAHALLRARREATKEEETQKTAES